MKYFNYIKDIIRNIIPVMFIQFLLIIDLQAFTPSGKGPAPAPDYPDQQGFVITGRVTSGIDNTIMPGVSIVVKGTQREL